MIQNYVHQFEAQFEQFFLNFNLLPEKNFPGNFAEEKSNDFQVLEKRERVTLGFKRRSVGHNL